MSTKLCPICKSSYYNVDKDEVCSQQCTNAKTHLDNAVSLIKITKPTEDPRIFFFPLTFGELCDKYSVLSLKRSFTKSISLQQKLDYRLFKLRRAIETHLGQLTTVIRANIDESFTVLFQTNAEIWRIRDAQNLYADKTLDGQEELLRIKRSHKISELDAFAGNQSTQSRIINGETHIP